MMFSKDDPIPEGYLTIDELLQGLRDRLKDQAKFPDDVEQWIQAGLTRSEIAKAAEQVRNGYKDEEQYRKLAKQLHREDRRADAANELAIAKIAAALSRGELHTLVRDPDTGEFFRIRPGDWRLMHLKPWTIQRGWLCVNANEPCASHKGRSVLVTQADAEQFLSRFGVASQPHDPEQKSNQTLTQSSKPSRPQGRCYAKVDRPLIEEMHRLMQEGCHSPSAAALFVVERAGGNSLPESKVKRLVSRYKARAAERTENNGVLR